VAGTNGKGSTIHYLKHALVTNGYRTGVFNSPSLEGLTGHISINDSVIPKKTFLTYINKIYPFILQLDNERNHPTEFEIITAIAFLYFTDNVDIALIETGMGGREDTTNCFVPILSIITNVAFDHTGFLGDNIKSIAYHKAGIIKENRPVIAGEMCDESLSVIADEAAKKNAPLYLMGNDFQYKVIDSTTTYERFRWTFTAGTSMETELQTAGTHQIRNASLAIMALVILDGKGFELNRENTMNGLAAARISGRFERIHTKPAIFLDGAHNPAGIQAFVDTVSTYFADKEKHLIFAAFKDKDLNRMLNDLEPHFSSVTLTTFDHPRAAGVEQLQDFSRLRYTRYQRDWRQAIEQISFQRENVCYFITGSLHFIAIVRKYFEEMSHL